MPISSDIEEESNELADQMMILSEEQNAILNKNIDNLSDEELFVSVPLTERIESYGVKAAYTLKLRQRKSVNHKRSETSTQEVKQKAIADTRLKINGAG